MANNAKLQAVDDLYTGPAQVAVEPLSPQALASWTRFVQQDPHEMLLKLNWLMRRIRHTKRGAKGHASKVHLGVVWHLVSTCIRTQSAPNTPCLLSVTAWGERYSQFFGEGAAKQPMFNRPPAIKRMTDHGWISLADIDGNTLGPFRPGSKKLIRLRWLNWPALQAEWDAAVWPPREVLEAYYFAGSDVVGLFFSYFHHYAAMADADGYVPFRVSFIKAPEGFAVPWYGVDEIKEVYFDACARARWKHEARDRFIERARARETRAQYYALRIKQNVVRACRDAFYGTDVLGF